MSHRRTRRHNTDRSITFVSDLDPHMTFGVGHVERTDPRPWRMALVINSLVTRRSASHPESGSQLRHDISTQLRASRTLWDLGDEKWRCALSPMGGRRSDGWKAQRTYLNGEACSKTQVQISGAALHAR